jgi:hypothetical protein
MILPPSMVPLKKTMKSDTFLSMAIIWHHTVATHHTCCEEEFYDTCELPDHEDLVDDLLDTVHPEILSYIYGVHSSKISKVAPNFDFIHPLFGWAPADTIKRTFGATTQQHGYRRVSDTIK